MPDISAKPRANVAAPQPSRPVDSIQGVRIFVFERIIENLVHCIETNAR